MRRRRFIAGLAVAAIAVLVAAIAAGSGGSEERGGGAGADAAADVATATGSTLARTFRDSDGDGVLERAPGERLRARTELAPRARVGKTIATLAQISDAHVRDEESPARAFLLDRAGDPFTSTFRPQEALSPQVLAAAVESVNAARPQAVLVTGDLVDEPQQNELDQALAVVEGGAVDPDSGAPGYDGPQARSSADPFIYRPDVDAPRHPGLLDRAQRRFRSPGLRAPWFPVLGNHDLLVGGVAPPSPVLERLAVGDRAPAELDPDVERPRTEEDLERLLAQGFPGRTVPIPADPARRYLGASAVLERLRRASGSGGSGERLDYGFDVGRRLRVIVLDAERRDGGAEGRIGPEQLAWLRTELERAGRRRVIVASHQPLTRTEGGQAVLAALDRSPQVIAALWGHTHRSSIEPRRSAGGGYWLIATPSLTDYPQQARMLRFRETAGGGVAIETWMLDTAPGPLADVSRELAFLDAQGGRPQGNVGSARDRNVRLFVR